jgi:hypothetical protein
VKPASGFLIWRDEGTSGGAEKVEGVVNIFDFRFLIFDLANRKEIYD